MPASRKPNRVLLVTGLSGAGKSTVLKTLEDLGWEAVDNFPIRLARPLLALPPAEGQAPLRPRPRGELEWETGRPLGGTRHEGGSAGLPSLEA